MNAKVDPIYEQWQTSWTKSVVDALRKNFRLTLATPPDSLPAPTRLKQKAIENAIALLIEYHETHHVTYTEQDRLRATVADLRRALFTAESTRNTLYRRLVNETNNRADLEQQIERQKQEIQQLAADAETFARAHAEEEAWRKSAVAQLGRELQHTQEQSARINVLRNEIDRLSKQGVALIRLAAQSTDALLKELDDDAETTS